jgi:hypothetical protein
MSDREQARALNMHLGRVGEGNDIIPALFPLHKPEEAAIFVYL